MLTAGDIEQACSGLRELLLGDVPRAATILEKLTGPILVYQVQENGKPKPTWMAEFTATALPALLEAAVFFSYPTRDTLEVLNNSCWTMEVPCKVALEKVPGFVQYAALFKKLRDQGMTINEIAAAHDRGPQFVRYTLIYADTGHRPNATFFPAGVQNIVGVQLPTRREEALIMQYAEEITDMRTSNRMSFASIAEQIANRYEIPFSAKMATKAYDLANPSSPSDPNDKIGKLNRGCTTRLEPEKLHNLLSTLRDHPGWTNKAIAAAVGCSKNCVRRERIRQTGRGRAARRTSHPRAVLRERNELAPHGSANARSSSKAQIHLTSSWMIADSNAACFSQGCGQLEKLGIAPRSVSKATLEAGATIEFPLVDVGNGYAPQLNDTITFLTATNIVGDKDTTTGLAAEIIDTPP